VIDPTNAGIFFPVVMLIAYGAAVGGIFIILNAIFKLKDYGLHGDYAQHSPWSIIMMIAIGVLLIHSHQFISDWQETIFNNEFGYPNGNPLDFGIKNDDVKKKWDAAHEVILSFIVLWGFFSFTRGLFVWHQTTLGYKNSSFWKGFFHCLGGCSGNQF
jgi:hypothetical protein